VDGCGARDWIRRKISSGIGKLMCNGVLSTSVGQRLQSGADGIKYGNDGVLKLEVRVARSMLMLGAIWS
jgi:hypothetical protein